MKALMFSRPYSIEVIETELPKLEPDEVLVKVGACGVCGTDFHIYSGEAPASFPVICGHEFSGYVSETGMDAMEFNLGSKVAINPNIHCGYCKYCKEGRVHLCENLRAIGVTSDGGFAEYCIVPKSQLYLINSTIDLKYASFAEPLSCCIHGVEKAEVHLCNSVTIVGSGAIGLLMLQLVLLKGASKLVVIDIEDEKLKTAKHLGASKVFNSSSRSFEDEFKSYMNGGSDIVIECAGNSDGAKLALECANKGAKIVLFGLAPRTDKLTFNLQDFFHKELSIRSSLLNPNTFGKAVELINNNKIRFDLFNLNLIPLENDRISELFRNKRDSKVNKNIIIP